MSQATFLNGRAPTQLRGAAWLALSDTGYHLSLSGTTDSGGGEIQTWGTAGTFDCRIDPLAGGEATVANQVSDRSTHLLTLPPQTSITHNDRFKVNGDTYEITAVRSRTAELTRQVELVEVS